jgi:hypothetical protein
VKDKSAGKVTLWLTAVVTALHDPTEVFDFSSVWIAYSPFEKLKI